MIHLPPSNLQGSRNNMHTQKCIWMEAGSVDYQLCPLKQNCDLCDFHERMTAGCRSSKLNQEMRLLEVRNPDETSVQFTPGLQFFNRHFWLKRIGDGKIRLGMDTLLWQLFSSTQKIVTAKIDSSLHQLQCFAWFQLDGEIIYLRTPFPGRVARKNSIFLGDKIPDRHLYLTPESELWLIELEEEEVSFPHMFLSKMEYLAQTQVDYQRYNALIQNEIGTDLHIRPRSSLISKTKFSTYLQTISEGLAIIC